MFNIHSVSTTDIDYLCEIVAPWNLFLKKLDKGKDFYVKVDLFTSNDFIIVKTDFGSALEQSGAPPEGMRTLWVPADDDQHFYWRNNNINGKTIGFFPLGAELDCTSKPEFKVYVISLPEQFLMQESFKLGKDWSLAGKSGYPDHLLVDEQIVLTLRQLLTRLFLLKNSNLTSDQLRITFTELKARIVELFIGSCLSDSKQTKPDLTNRLRVFKHFKDYINLYPNAPYSSADLCDFTAASERTLQYVIRDYTQLSPNQYAKALKQNMVRNQLIKGNPEDTRIVQIAFDYGFWNYAQFTTDYKRLFGESPSETLRLKG